MVLEGDIYETRLDASTIRDGGPCVYKRATRKNMYEIKCIQSQYWWIQDFKNLPYQSRSYFLSIRYYHVQQFATGNEYNPKSEIKQTQSKYLQL